MAFTKAFLILIILSEGGQGQLLSLYTDPPSNGNVHLYCDAVQSNFTIACNYSANIQFTPDIVINGVKLSVGELDERYTLEETELGVVVLQFRLSSDLNGYNFSCVLNETVASRTITILADFNQCPANVSPSTPVATGASSTQMPTTSQTAPLPSQTPTSNGNGTNTSPTDDQVVIAVVVVVVVAIVVGVVLVVVFGAALMFWYFGRKKAAGGEGEGQRGELHIHENPVAMEIQGKTFQAVNNLNHQQPKVIASQLDQPEEDRNELPEQYANSSAAAAELEVEGNGELQRPRTEGGRGSEERLNTAIQESNGSSNCSQSNLVISTHPSPLTHSPLPPAAALPEKPVE